MKKPLTVNCPTCQTNVIWAATSEHRPFCSERCQKIDLGAWADESYSIAAVQQDEWELSDATQNKANPEMNNASETDANTDLHLH
jgi:endogenous inhibitor of DNA gyrase (YacG/DUF329 family)